LIFAHINRSTNIQKKHTAKTCPWPGVRENVFCCLKNPSTWRSIAVYITRPVYLLCYVRYKQTAEKKSIKERDHMSEKHEITPATNGIIDHRHRISIVWHANFQSAAKTRDLIKQFCWIRRWKFVIDEEVYPGNNTSGFVCLCAIGFLLPVFYIMYQSQLPLNIEKKKKMLHNARACD
jgi:hypothetical protein